LVLELVDVGVMVQKNLSSLHSQIERMSFQIENEVSKETIIRGVPAYVDSAILNIITNSVKYRNKNKSSFLKIRSFFEKDFQVLEFEDNGIGIDLEKYKNDLFGLYKTFHDNKDSRGIGLFITKNQMEQMGGRIEITSRVDHGSTFRLYFLK
jgi:signal transduction histidine kinase